MATKKHTDDPLASTVYESPRFYVAFLGLGLGSWVMSDCTSFAGPNHVCNPWL